MVRALASTRNETFRSVERTHAWLSVCPSPQYDDDELRLFLSKMYTLPLASEWSCPLFFFDRPEKNTSKNKSENFRSATRSIVTSSGGGI